MLLKYSYKNCLNILLIIDIILSVQMIIFSLDAVYIYIIIKMLIYIAILYLKNKKFIYLAYWVNSIILLFNVLSLTKINVIINGIIVFLIMIILLIKDK